MDAKQFLAEFGTISSAPDGVQRIRELILQMAVSGRLVQYDRTEDTIEADIHEARRLRIQYSEELKLKNSRTRSTFRQEEIPYPIPVHWRWQRLEQIASYIQRGKGPKYANSGAIRVVSQKCVRWDGFELSPARYLDPKVLNSYGNERFLQPDDLLWNSTGTGTVGRVAIYKPEQNVDTVADSHVTVVRLSNFIPRYVWCVIASPWVQARMAPEHEGSLVSGTTNQVELSTSSVRGLQVPCPPIAEQQRIVAKVDELMALCDKLEAQQRERENKRKTVRKSVFGSLTSVNSTDELYYALQRVQQELPILCNLPEDVTDLRATILDLAAIGKLSEPLPNDTEVWKLLEEIKSKRDDFVTDGRIRTNRRPPTRIKDTDVQPPPNWAKAHLEELFRFIDYRGKTPTKTNSGRVLITAKNVRPGYINSSPTEYISEENYHTWMTRGFPLPGDLLFTTEAPLGNIAQIEGKADFALAQRVINLQPISKVNTRFFMYFMMSPTFQDILWQNASGITAKGIKAAKLRRLSVFVPPIEEQERIVRRIESLFRYCQQLDCSFDDFEH